MVSVPAVNAEEPEPLKLLSAYDVALLLIAVDKKLWTLRDASTTIREPFQTLRDRLARVVSGGGQVGSRQ